MTSTTLPAECTRFSNLLPSVILATVGNGNGHDHANDNDSKNSDAAHHEDEFRHPNSKHGKQQT